MTAMTETAGARRAGTTTRRKRSSTEIEGDKSPDVAGDRKRGRPKVEKDDESAADVGAFFEDFDDRMLSRTDPPFPPAPQDSDSHGSASLSTAEREHAGRIAEAGLGSHEYHRADE